MLMLMLMMLDDLMGRPLWSPRLDRKWTVQDWCLIASDH